MTDTRHPGAAAGRSPDGSPAIVWIPVPEAMAFWVLAQVHADEPEEVGRPGGRPTPTVSPLLARWIGRLRQLGAGRSGRSAFASTFPHGSET